MASSEAIVFAEKGNVSRQLSRFWVTMADGWSSGPPRRRPRYGPRVMPGARSWAVPAVLIGSPTST